MRSSFVRAGVYVCVDLALETGACKVYTALAHTATGPNLALSRCSCCWTELLSFLLKYAVSFGRNEQKKNTVVHFVPTTGPPCLKGSVSNSVRFSSGMDTVAG